MEDLCIKNFGRYQHYKERRPPWIKLHNSLLDDRAFLLLDEVQQCRYMKLLLLASLCDNRIPNDPNYLKKVLRLDSEVDLKPLIDAGFLKPCRKRSASIRQASRKQTAMPETETETETKGKTETKSPQGKGKGLRSFGFSPTAAALNAARQAEAAGR